MLLPWTIMIQDSVLSALQMAVTNLRHQRPRKKQLSFAFISLFKSTNEPNRIWTANWFRQQITVLASSFDINLLQGLKMPDLTAILTQDALSLWHGKVVNEHTGTMALTHRQLVLVPTANAASDPTVQLVCPPMSTTQTAHPLLS